MDKYWISTDDGQSWTQVPELSVMWIVGSLTWERRLRELVNGGSVVNSGGLQIKKSNLIHGPIVDEQE